MENIKKLSEKYFESLNQRSKQSRVYRDYQLIGLQLAEILRDRQHRSLYIKLAKNYNSDKLLDLANKIAERGDIKNKGAYFMKVFYDADSHYRKKAK